MAPLRQVGEARSAGKAPVCSAASCGKEDHNKRKRLASPHPRSSHGCTLVELGFPSPHIFLLGTGCLHFFTPFGLNYMLF